MDTPPAVDPVRRARPRHAPASPVPPVRPRGLARGAERGTVLLVGHRLDGHTGLAHALVESGHRVVEAASARAAIALARREAPNGLILDLDVPGMDGLAVLEAVLAQAPGIPAIVTTGQASIPIAVEAMKRGASEFVTGPIQVDDLLSRLDRGLDRARAQGFVVTPRPQAVSEMERHNIIAHSRVMLDLFDRIKRIAPHQSTVLVLGESGTGKELVARALHDMGPRARGSFVPVNCATLSEAILETEIFGHERGAFTGADAAKVGLMEVADGGTLFLDEVNEMGPACQAKLLRALDRREFRRVGGTRKIKVGLNLIASSNVNLEGWVAGGRFRPDLYYRLSVVTIEVPPLRARREGIPVLARRFLDDIARRAGIPPKRLAPEALAQLTRYAWPGNIRELRNCLEGLTLTVPRPVIQRSDLPAALRGSESSEIRLAVGVRLADAEREIIRRTLESAATIKEAARVLGIGLRTLHTKIRLFDLARRR
jgi:DNA-binding NtrC family response regulator